MQRQSGFTLFELMISISIIAILSAIGVPAYQRYIQKAAMTDILQSIIPYKTAIELCLLESGALSSCQQEQYGIPGSKSTRYISAVTVNKGVITVQGQQTLAGLQLVLTPTADNSSGTINWQKQCGHQEKNLVAVCNEMIHFADQNTEGE